MTFQDYILKRYKILKSKNDRILLSILNGLIENFGIYKVKNDADSSIVFVRISNESFFDEFYKTYIHLYNDKSYYVWYRTVSESFKYDKLRERRGIRKSKRNFIINRDGNKCVACNSIKNLTVDHLVPKSISNDDSLYNLITLCRKCNSEKGNADWGPNFLHDVVIPNIKNQKKR